MGLEVWWRGGQEESWPCRVMVCRLGEPLGAGHCPEERKPHAGRHMTATQAGCQTLCAPDRGAGTWESRVQPGACTAGDSGSVGRPTAYPRQGTSWT